MLYLFNNIIDKDIFDALLDYKKNPDTAISKLANFAIKNNRCRRFFYPCFIF